jgi:hypothetical protein
MQVYYGITGGRLRVAGRQCPNVEPVRGAIRCGNRDQQRINLIDPLSSLSGQADMKKLVASMAAVAALISVPAVALAQDQSGQSGRCEAAQGQSCDVQMLPGAPCDPNANDVLTNPHLICACENPKMEACHLMVDRLPPQQR